MLRSKEMLVKKYYFYLIDLKKCAAFTYAPFTLREDPIGLFMESDNYQPQLILKDIRSNIDDIQRFIRRNSEYELKKTFTLARGQNFIESVCSDSRIVLCILNTYSAMPEKIGRIANVFAKVSFENRR